MKKNKLFFVNRTLYFVLCQLLFVGCLLTASSCNQGNRVSDELKGRLKGKAEKHLRDSEQWGKVIMKELDKDFADELESLNGVNIDGVVDVYYKQTDTTHIIIAGNAKVVDSYRFTMEDGVLKVTYANEEARNAKLPVMYVYVNAPTLEKAILSGVGDLNVENPVVQAEDMNLSVSGSGDVDIKSEVTCGDFNMTINGAGDLDIERLDCMDSHILISGAGDVRIKKMKSLGNVTLMNSGAGDITAKVTCENMTAEISGAGDADIEVKCDVVTAGAHGKGDVTFKGTARKLIKSKSGFGTLSTSKLAVDELDRKKTTLSDDEDDDDDDDE